MALYSVEITEPVSSSRKVDLIGNLAGLSRTEVKRRLRRLPLAVQASISLSEAVSIQRQLSRVGVNARVCRVDVSVEDGKKDATLTPSERESAEEVIEIPDTDVRILEPVEPPQFTGNLKRHKITSFASRRNLTLIVLAMAAIISAYWYLEVRGGSRRIQGDLAASIEEWSRTLQQQDALIDKGITAQQIFNKLAEIEDKISTLLKLLKSPAALTQFSSQFEQAQQRNEKELVDLEFRRSLESVGYPLHPTCLVDQGMVRGASELPEGTRLRVQLLGSSNVEQLSYSAQIRDGVFKLVMDPALAGSVYDARATVASFSQQPPLIQRWAKSAFSLPEVGESSPEVTHADRTRGDVGQGMMPEVSPHRIETGSDHREALGEQGETHNQGASAAADSHLVVALRGALQEWTQTIQDAEQNLNVTKPFSLEDLYQKLLDIEARIDQMIGWARSQEARDNCLLERERVYGGYREVRNELDRQHEEFRSENSPYILEMKIKHEFEDRGLGQAQVVVIDAPNKTDAFVVDIEAELSRPDRLSALAIIVQVLAQELEKSPLTIDIIRLREANRVLTWQPQTIRLAAAALQKPNGEERCAEILEATP